MGSVGLRELRQEASEIVRRVEAGEQIDVTVSGRLAARIVPAAPKQWLQWADVEDVFTRPSDPAWEVDRRRLDQSVNDPWEPRR